MRLTLEDKRLIMTLLKELQMNLVMRGGKGHGSGHPYQAKHIKPTYGYEENVDGKEESTDNEPVKISRAFKGK